MPPWKVCGSRRPSLRRRIGSSGSSSPSFSSVFDSQLRRHAQSRVVVRCASVGVAWQQSGAGTIRAAVELQAELADQLDAEAQGALGIAGFCL